MSNPLHKTKAYDWATGLHVAYDTSTQSAALTANTEYILSPSTDCYVTIGENPTAVIGAGAMFVPAGALFHVWNVVADYKIAAIKLTSAGTLSIVKAT